MVIPKLSHHLLFHCIWLVARSIIESESMRPVRHEDTITSDLHVHQRVLPHSKREEATRENEYSETSLHAPEKKLLLGADALYHYLWFGPDSYYISIKEKFEIDTETKTASSRRYPCFKKTSMWHEQLLQAFVAAEEYYGLDLSVPTKDHVQSQKKIAKLLKTSYTSISKPEREIYGDEACFIYEKITMLFRNVITSSSFLFLKTHIHSNLQPFSESDVPITTRLHHEKRLHDSALYKPQEKDISLRPTENDFLHRYTTYKHTTLDSLNNFKWIGKSMLERLIIMQVKPIDISLKKSWKGLMIEVGRMLTSNAAASSLAVRVGTDLTELLKNPSTDNLLKEELRAFTYHASCLLKVFDTTLHEIYHRVNHNKAYVVRISRLDTMPRFWSVITRLNRGYKSSRTTHL